MSSASASRNRRGAPTRSPPRAASTPPRTTRTTATASIACSTTRSRAGDFRAREANVYRLAQVSATSSTSASRRACRSPANTAGCSTTARSAARRCRARFTPAARPASNLLLGAYPALCRQIGLGTVKMYPRTEMLDLVSSNGHAKGIIVRNLVTGEIDVARGRCGRAGDRRLRQRVLPLHQRQGLQCHGDLARLQAGRRLRQPLLHADSSDLHPRSAASTSPS